MKGNATAEMHQDRRELLRTYTEGFADLDPYAEFVFQIALEENPRRGDEAAAAASALIAAQLHRRATKPALIAEKGDAEADAIRVQARRIKRLLSFPVLALTPRDWLSRLFLDLDVSPFVCAETTRILLEAPAVRGHSPSSVAAAALWKAVLETEAGSPTQQDISETIAVSPLTIRKVESEL